MFILEDKNYSVPAPKSGLLRCVKTVKGLSAVLGFE